MQSWKPWMKWTVGAAGGALLLFALLLFTPPGLALIGRMVHPLTGGAVTVEGLGGASPNRLSAASVEIADAQGAWLRLTNVTLDWSVFSALRDHIRVRDVTAERIAVLRRPIASDSEESETPRITVAHFRFTRIDIQTPVIGRQAALTAEGALAYTSRHQLSADVTASRLDNGDRYRIAGGIAQDVAQGRIAIQEGADGILGDLAGLPGLGPVNLQARAGGTGAANTLSFTLTAGPLNASGQGTLQLAAERADMTFSAAAPQMALRPGLSWQALSATGRFYGSFTRPEIEAYLIVDNGAFDTLKAEQIALNIIGNAGRANLEAVVTGLTMPGEAADLFAHQPVTVKASADLKASNRPVAFSVNHPLMNLHGQATTRGGTTVTAQLAIPALAPFAATQGIDIRGTAGLDIAVNQAGPRTSMRLQGRMDTQGTAILARLLGRDAKLDFNIALENSDVVESRVGLRGAAITADANGTVRKGVLDYGATFHLSDLSRLSDILRGSLEMRGDANGPLATATLRARGSAQIATKGFAQQQVTIEMEASGLPAPNAGRLDVRGRLNGAPLSVQANLTGKQARQLALTARWKSLDASADITLPEVAPIAGQMRIAVRQLADIALFTGAQITGAANAALVLKANRGKTDAQLTADLDEVQLGFVRLGSADLQGAIADLFDNRSFDITLAAQDVDASGFTGDLSLEFDGPQDKLAAKLLTNLKDESGAATRLDATALANMATSKVTLQSLSGAWRGVELALKEPATIDYAQGLAIDRLAARLGDGDITASGQLLPRLQLSASAQGITLSSFKSFTPNGTAQGTLSGMAELSGTLAAPQGIITLKGSGLRTAFSGRAVPPATLDARAQLMGGHAAITANVQGGNATSLAVSGTIGLAADAAIDLHAKGNADLALFDPLLAADGRRLRGKLVFETDITGTLTAPRVTGSGQLSDGEFQDYLRGLQVQGISAAIQAQGATIRVTQFQGRAGTGTLSGSGSIDLSAPGLPVDFTLNAKNARPIVSDLFTATLSGNLKMTGTLTSQMNLSGDIQVLGGEINLPDKFPPEVAVLNIRQRGRTAPPPPATSRANLDIAVRTTGPIFVRGHGVDAEMGGAIRVGGTSAAPTISGGFQMNRGSYDAAGQRLDFTTGRIGFDGTGLRNRFDPTLDFVAQTVSGGITARLNVTGYASAPRIVLSSTPQLPQDEIVSRLLFQQDVKQLTPLQLASIAQALAAMGGVGGNLNPLGMVRRNLGLDRLSVGSNGAAGEQSRTTVEAGRYISRGVYVGVKQTLSGGTQTQVQVDITQRLKAQATLSTGTDATTTPRPGEDTGSSIGLAYELEY